MRWSSRSPSRRSFTTPSAAASGAPGPSRRSCPRRAPGCESTTSPSRTSSTSSPSEAGSRRWCSISMVVADRSIFPSPSSQTVAPTGGSKSYGSASATGRWLADTPTARRCCSPTPTCASQTSWATTSVRSRRAMWMRSWRHSSRRAALTSTEVATPRARSTSCCSRTAAASRWNIARRSTTAGRACWSTTSCGGPDGPRARGRGRRLRAEPRRQARRGPHLRRRRPSPRRVGRAGLGPRVSPGRAGDHKRQLAIGGPVPGAFDAAAISPRSTFSAAT